MEKYDSFDTRHLGNEPPPHRSVDEISKDIRVSVTALNKLVSELCAVDGSVQVSFETTRLNSMGFGYTDKLSVSIYQEV